MTTPRNPYERLVRRLGRQRWFAWFGRRVLTPVDRLLEDRGVSLTTAGTHFPLCYLTTIGRHTGQPRTVPLLYVAAGEGIAVVASNFGGEHHPAWSHNLDAEPHATVHIGDERRPMVARRATEEEEATLMPEFVDVWPAYEDYAERTDRHIRMFVLEPLGYDDA
jgi:deazaflavin-dependent oxidoreductase (nitroreductase family)